MSVLERVNSSEDIKKLSASELEQFCREARAFLVDNISKTGGHLASNLGAVELTVALHRVFDTSRDRLVFDVGHQSYVHKMITGRREQFSTLRQHGGLAGFPKPYESGDDAFVAGHASNSVSVALGMARGRSLLGDDYHVIAVIGDGALTGGLAFEGLAGAAASGEPMVIVINDNNMSIDPNVGGTASLLQDMRVRSGYISFKHWFKKRFRRFEGFYRAAHDLKERIKTRLLPGNTFVAMGLNYLGPIDGHDIARLEKAFRLAKEHNGPVVVHVLTEKGKGVPYAEEHPELYHGVGPFDPVSGIPHSGGPNFSETFGKYLSDFAGEEPRICAITAAMASGTGLDGFAKIFPERFVDAGIAEGHAVAMAAGMAKQGAIPVFAVYSSFLQRGYDMLIHDISLLGLHAVFAVDRAGLVGNDGETHHGSFDVNYLCSVPGLTVYSPASFAEQRDMLREALFEQKGPCAIRYPRGGEGAYTAGGTAAEAVLREGRDVTILCYGIMVNEALEAARLLEEKQISAEVVKLGILKPAGLRLTLASLGKTRRLLVSEDVCQAGCMGQRILAACAAEGICLKGQRLLNLGEGIVSHGKCSELFRDYGLDAQGIAEAVCAMMEGER